MLGQTPNSQCRLCPAIRPRGVPIVQTRSREHRVPKWLALKIMWQVSGRAGTEVQTGWPYTCIPAQGTAIMAISHGNGPWPTGYVWKSNAQNAKSQYPQASPLWTHGGWWCAHNTPACSIVYSLPSFHWGGGKAWAGQSSQHALGQKGWFPACTGVERLVPSWIWQRSQGIRNLEDHEEREGRG